ncbi:MAG: macro domain-containing protein [Propionibacteriaceae bacterium]|jgi:O-acetyl-ADP-ribose deacetylase (regulator of RNase III)|nr:macro domain-containing protein [Propionibacteriaceae bacterium]
MPFTIVRQDITQMDVDAIVNAANTGLEMGGGVCGAIFRAAGPKQLQAACDRLAPIQTGDAVITPGFALPAKYVIHAAGPVYRPWDTENSELLLRAAYTNSLKRAIENNCESVAFPLISSGTYGYPKDEALRVATSAIRDFLDRHDIDVRLVVFDKESFAVSEELLGEVASYIDEHFVVERTVSRRRLLDIEREALEDIPAILSQQAFSGAPQATAALGQASTPAPSVRLEDIVGNLDESFASTLLRLIDASGKTDPEIYNRANIDRRLFSKIRSNPRYTPSKPTVIAFAIALELTLGQTEDLLERAGFALSHARLFDVIVEYFIASGKCDVYEINEVLFAYDQPLLAG